jgi:hypothetical protein
MFVTQVDQYGDFDEVLSMVRGKLGGDEGSNKSNSLCAVGLVANASNMVIPVKNWYNCDLIRHVQLNRGGKYPLNEPIAGSEISLMWVRSSQFDKVTRCEVTFTPHCC